MSTASRDYYEILGVPRDADDEAIKKAFRRLARELHPDVNPDDPTAEERFKEVAEAYKVLSEPDTRQLYDRHGHAGLRGGAAGPDFGFASFQDIFDSLFGGGDVFGRGRPRARAGDDHLVGVEITFVESARGVAREVAVDLLGDCASCEGTGLAPGAELVECDRCDGRGEIRQVVRSPLGQMVRATICTACQGEGRVPSQRCADCRGSGRARARETVDLDIPAGIADGQRLRLPGRAHAGDPGAPRGDLYVEVRVAADERFLRDGLDVVTRVAVPVADAMTGTSVTVPTIDGEEQVDLAPGTQPLSEHVLRGKGFPQIQGRGRGDQRVVVEVVVPRVTSDEGRELLGRLGEHMEAEADDEGLFGRLRRKRRR
jgi:molecular chaperone DnaJ